MRRAQVLGSMPSPEDRASLIVRPRKLLFCLINALENQVPQVFFIDRANMRGGVEPWSSGFTTILKGSGKPSTPPRVASPWFLPVMDSETMLLKRTHVKDI